MPSHNPRLPAHLTDLSMPPPPDKIIPIDTAAPSTSSNNADVAGVLRRNQACLQCRKRKLARPHCATCVRSYRHLLRTSPKSNPVLCCDYDDGGSHHHDEGDKGEKGSTSKSPAQETHEEETAGGKKKRKANGEGKRKKKDEEFEEERDRLTKKIEELQAQLTQNLQNIPQGQSTTQSVPPAQNIPQPNRSFSSSSNFAQNAMSAPSPTAFLEMLSSAASSQIPKEPTNIDDTAAEGTSMTDGPFWGGGQLDFIDGIPELRFKPMFMFDHSKNQSDSSAVRGDPSPGVQSEESRRSSLQNATPGTGGDSSSQSTNILSPGGVFNFSPGPATNLMSSWPPAPDPVTGNLEPSTKVDGPWRAVETVETILTASMNAAQNQAQNQQNFGGDSIMETEINLDGLQAGLDAAMQQQLLMDLFWPGWPINLPEPNVVNDLIEAFFDLVPNLPRVLHRARFLSRMALPPTHTNFPHPSLIHAICAAAAAWCAPELYEKSVRGKGRDFFDTAGMGMYGTDVLEGKNSKANLTFGLRQASFAKEAVTEGLNTGNRLFDVVRAMIILERVFIDDTRMLECWAYGGLVARMLLPLGLNVRSAELSLKSVMLPPPADALEREERRAAVWMAFYHDTIASAASGWGTSMSLDELTVPLPVSAKDFDDGNDHMQANPQDLESPDFWVKHPVPDSFVMTIKATVLLNRVNKFARRWKNRHMKDNDDFDGLNRSEFREIANAIACFQMSFPPSLRNVGKLSQKKALDIDLIAAHMIPHAAIICLHEPFADLNDPSDQAVRRMLGATQAIVSIVQQLASVVGMNGSNFTSVMHSSASVCLVTSARTSLLFLRHALNIGDMAAAQSHRTDCEMIRMALSQFGLKFKIGHHHSQLIEYFLDRATNPTYEKLQAHYPDHPRSGAPELTPTSNFGLCVANALNIKRGFWRVHIQTASAGASPFGSTPESMGSGSHASRPHASSSSSVSHQLSDADSPNHPHDGPKSQQQTFRQNTSNEAMETDSPPNGVPSKNNSGVNTEAGRWQANKTTSGTQGPPNTQEYQFAGLAFPTNDPSTAEKQAKLNEYGLCDFPRPRPPQKQTSLNSASSGENTSGSINNRHPLISPATKSMEDRIIQGRLDGYFAETGIWTVDDKASQMNNQQNQNQDARGGLGHQQPEFDISAPPGVTPVSQEMKDKIQARHQLKDGQYPVWMNTTEEELLSDAKKQQRKPSFNSNNINLNLNTNNIPPASFWQEATNEQLYMNNLNPNSFNTSGMGGNNFGMSSSTNQAFNSMSSNLTNNNHGNDNNSGMRFDTLDPEIEAKFSKIKTIGKDGHQHVIQNLTQEDIMIEICKNGNLPTNNNIGYKEGQKEQGRVGDMLRNFYDIQD
ncbi:uncharacterized protein L201_000256 [Kwoniella dendrophila CBS 6074]|uniref:Xylanolytic transcriptional activator regulatory domain-containing protein n=1 Tax=Kwoniella dendrophila CBS 6074 TaxID=1295534 RepID=A0AAX4JLW5_9TREE